MLFVAIANYAYANDHADAHRFEHPDTSGPEWVDLFDADLSNAEYSTKAWAIEEGVLTASEDEVIWSHREFENFMIDLEFKTAEGTNSGIIVYATDKSDWIPNSVEIQITDDHCEKWSTAPKSWQCGAIFGHLAPQESRVKKPGDWNRMTAICEGKRIRVAVNGRVVTDMNMELWTSAKVNPDGSEIPAWLNRPFSKLDTRGGVGLQGKHGDAPVSFRNIRVREY